MDRLPPPLFHLVTWALQSEKFEGLSMNPLDVLNLLREGNIIILLLFLNRIAPLVSGHH